MTVPTNVFEWHWEHSKATGATRQILLALAFEAEDDRRIRSSVPALAASIGLRWTDGSTAVSTLIQLGELAEEEPGHPAPVYTFPAYEAARLPHTLTLSTWDGEPYEGEDAHRWDDATVECPHQPGTETMPCARWEPCGCPDDSAEGTDHAEGAGNTTGLCPHSVTGTHRCIDGKPARPVASCWTLDWEDSIADRAFGLGLTRGTHLVRPWWDGEQVHLELVKSPTVATVKQETLAHKGQ